MKCKSMEKPKPKHRKGLWSPEEDQRLRDYVLNYGHGCWSSVPVNAGLQRNGKSCRLRWINYLRPGLKRGMFTAQEEETILSLHRMLGNKWSQISHHLPGRTDNEIKNHWHSYLKKKLAHTEAEIAHQIKSESNSHTESPLSQDHLPTPQNPTTVTSLPKILFAEWLTLDDNSSNSTVADTFSAFDHAPSSFVDNGATAMASHSDPWLWQQQEESLVQSVPLSGDGVFEGNKNGNFEDIRSGSSSSSFGDMYGTMEDQMLETELLELLSINGVYSSSDLTYI